jgi:hypothetical protein
MHHRRQDEFTDAGTAGETSLTPEQGVPSAAAETWDKRAVQDASTSVLLRFVAMILNLCCVIWACGYCTVSSTLHSFKAGHLFLGFFFQKGRHHHCMLLPLILFLIYHLLLLLSTEMHHVSGTFLGDS